MKIIKKFEKYDFVTKLTIVIILFAILLRFIIAAYTIEGGDPCYHASAGLSYYYFLANMITFGQTFLMQKFVNEDELHRKIQENKKKPVKVSSFQQKLEQMAKQRQAQIGKKK